ncbi:hypothetical protein KDA_74410 [Dictyobacter alpinus]|uniref:Response regulatory domain-containing protein n=1 Tax=Dictyobacter alpinus TaxID=2014873 RepID=A0A402BKR3_9CHLR|nr:response regulator [Dictyobacter alpinus]GCE31957.1 hypothetical protein KDA_74410 [Dictyobacter alpinus]
MCKNHDRRDAAYHNQTVLIVEDNTILGMLLQEALQECIHCQVHLVITAEMAIAALKTLTPALFIVDYLLPQMNGLQLADHLQSSTGTEHLPIIMLSTTLPEEVSLRHQIKYMRKPFDLEAFLQLVVELLPLQT